MTLVDWQMSGVRVVRFMGLKNDRQTLTGSALTVSKVEDYLLIHGPFFFPEFFTNGFQQVGAAVYRAGRAALIAFS